MNAALCRAPQQADNKASHSGVCLFQLCAVLCSPLPSALHCEGVPDSPSLREKKKRL